MPDKFAFKQLLINTTFLDRLYAQTALANLNNDRVLEYIVGEQYGTIFYYQYHAPDY